MDSAPPKALYFAAGILLAIALITLAVLVYSNSTEPAKASSSEFNSLSSDLKDQKFLSFDNTTVSGSQVVNSVRRFSTEGKNGEFGIKVVTGQGNSTWYYNTVSNSGDTITSSTAATTELNNTNSSQYVNPSGIFKANIVRDSNQVIRAIEFVQQSK